MVVAHILDELWHLHTLNKHLFLCVGILVHMSNTGLRPFFEQKKFKGFSRTFQGLSRTYFPFSRTLFSAKKSLVLPQHEQFYPEGLSVFAPFSLEFYLKLKSKHWNSRTFQHRLSTLWKGSYMKGMCTQYWTSPSLTCFWVLSWLIVCSCVLNNSRYFLRKPVIIHQDFSQAKRVTTWMQIKHKWY